MSSGSASVDYSEQGEGPALLFLPGSFGTGAGWRGVIEALGPHYRCVTTSLLGDGGTAERRAEATPSTAMQMQAIDEVVARIAAPVHLVGIPMAASSRSPTPSRRGARSRASY